jgi:3-isopropylmalate dehydrogenase
MARIALIPGDGIGSEVIREAERVLSVVADLAQLSVEWDRWPLGADHFLETGSTITEDQFRRLEQDYDAILLGALGDPRVPGNEHARDILLGLRARLDLFVNYRPCRVLRPEHSPLRAAAGSRMDLHIFRENTEGIYGGVGGSLRTGTPDEVAIEEDINTRKGVERILRAAFEFAELEGRERVTVVDKANAMPFAGGLWRRTLEAVRSDHPGLEVELMYVDAMVMDMVRRPDHHGVVVTSNLFGDILSDLAAALVGGLGLAPSANLHPGRHALFEPVHGSAPDLAGLDQANPMAAILCVALLLTHLGEGGPARAVRTAVEAAMDEGIVTPDLGGTKGTGAVGEWIADRVAHLLEEAHG